jgi:hypothetical protein
MYVNCNYRIAATLYTLETWFVSGRPCIIVSSLHKDDYHHHHHHHHHHFLPLVPIC